MGMTAAFVLLLVSGILNGSTTVPIKFAKNSQWENLWTIQAASGMLVLPWLLALVTVPHLMEVYQASGFRSLLVTALFGLGWGLGSVLFVWGIVLIGMSIGFAVVLSLTATLGSILPLIILTPAEIHTRRGHALLLSLGVAVLGITLCAIAGVDPNTSEGRTANSKTAFWRGLFICILSGLFSPMLNFSFAFGEKIMTQAQHFGATEFGSANAVWALTFSSAFIVNSVYCTWHIGGVEAALAHFRKAPAENLTAGSAMGLLQMLSIVFYGIAAQGLGKFGTTSGWAIIMCTTILAANIWGMITDEWRNFSRRQTTQLLMGLGCIGIAIILASPQ